MDLVGAISNYTQAQTISQVQIAVAKKILDVQQQQGGAAVQLLNAATQGFSQAGDQVIAAATGLGGSLDTYA